MPPKRKRKGKKKPTGDKIDPGTKALTREIELSALNTKRYRHLWREMLMRIKMPDIRKNVRATWQTLEHALDLKDYSISLLMDHLYEARYQRRKANGAFVEATDQSLEIHQDRMQTLYNLFQQNLTTDFVDKIQEFDNINYYRNKNESTLRTLNLFVHLRNENTASVAKSTAISRIEAFVDDGRNERRLIATQLQKQLEEIWDRLRGTFIDYRKDTDDRRKAYNTIRKKDDVDRQAITRHRAHIAHLHDDMARFRERIQSYKIDAENQIRDIMEEVTSIYNTYHAANQCFLAGYTKDKDRARTMSKEYSNSVKYLNTLVNKAERILLYMQMCRKYETQDEKTLPAVVDCVTSKAQRAAKQNSEDGSVALAAEDSDSLSSFWHRLGFVRLITAELFEEKEGLMKVSANLRTFMKSRFNGSNPNMQSLF